MAKREEFKSFIKKNPHLLKYIQNEKMTWQKFYEIYDLYGDDQAVWADYQIKDNKPKKEKITDIGYTDILSWLKSVDLDSIQNGVGSLQRVLSVFQDLSTNNTSKPKEEYKPRPLYHHFED
ncbi:MAG: spore coat protein YlbD [Bacilli bacterium]